MYALISLEKIQLPAGAAVRLPATWQEYQTLCEQRGNVQIAYDRNTSAAIRDLRQRLLSDNQ